LLNAMKLSCPKRFMCMLFLSNAAGRALGKLAMRSERHWT
jgi:hypothetical protein